MVVFGISVERELVGSTVKKGKSDETHEPSQTPLRNQRNNINVDKPAVSFRRQDFH